MRILGVIIARGGSRRLPGKNIRLLGGKPLIAWSIDAARGASTLDGVIVSTDSPEIAGVAKEFGALVPFLRPASLAGDTSSPVDVLRHAAEFMDGADGQVDVLVLLQATSPFRTPDDIDAAVRLLLEKQADTVVSVSAANDHPYWTWTERNGFLAPYFSASHMAMARQALPPAFVENGVLYVVRREVLQQSGLYGEKVVPYLISPGHAADIDTEEDFVVAERMLSEVAQ